MPNCQNAEGMQQIFPFVEILGHVTFHVTRNSNVLLLPMSLSLFLVVDDQSRSMECPGVFLSGLVVYISLGLDVIDSSPPFPLKNAEPP